MGQIENGVLLVSDVAEDFEEVSLARHDLEISERETIDDLLGGIEGCGLRALHIVEPRDIPTHVLKFRHGVVLSIWSGANSRNRRSLVPAICEAHGIPYIGADAYAALITTDKGLSKSVCAEFGIKTATSIMLRTMKDVRKLEHLQYPIVLKPLFEGGSIGITQTNKVSNPEEFEIRARTLFEHFAQPILCEEFLPGREVSICIIGRSQVSHLEAVEVSMDGEPEYFDYNLFSMEDKRLPDRKKKQRFLNVSEELQPLIFDRARNLYRSLGKVDYMRIDGKFHNEEFRCIELSTDPSISRSSLFAHSFYTQNMSYAEMIREILSTQSQKVGGDKL